MDYAHKCKVLRALLGLSQADLSGITAIGNFDLSKIETGKVLPSEVWDRRIRAALSWTPAVDAALEALAAAVAGEREEAA